MAELQLGRAIRIVLRTTPYLMYRAVIYGAVCLGLAVYLALLGFVGVVFSAGAFWLLLVLSLGLVIFLGWSKLIAVHFFYLLEAGHVALLTEIVMRDYVPFGVSQPGWAKDQVTHLFPERRVLRLINEFVAGTVHTIHERLADITCVMPVPASARAVVVAKRVADFSAAMIGDTVLASLFTSQSRNVFDGARTALILYCQAWKALLKNAIALAALGCAFIVVAAVVWMIPLGVVAVALPGTWSTMKLALFLIAVSLGVSTRWILFDPVARASAILTFLEVTGSLSPDVTWEARLESESDAFRRLKQKAEDQSEEMRRRAPGVSAR